MTDGGGVRGVVALEDVLARLIGDVRDAAAERRRLDDRSSTTDGEGAVQAAATGAGAGGR